METVTQHLDSNSRSHDDRFSEIAEFFNGCNVLLTGGSGFVGRLLIEKLLRSCPNLGKLYIVLRGKKNKSSDERFKEIFDDALYQRLRTEQPNFKDKVQMIEGELNDSGLVLSHEDRELIKNLHIVFHGAATVRFDDKLRFAVNINVRGTKEILLLCQQMPNLKAFVHIGTAYSQCVNKFIDEVFYEPPIDCDKILGLLDLLTDEQLDDLTPRLLTNWPNTYAFTKSIAENVVLKYNKDLPVCIVRPSIMIPTSEDPTPGWINNIYGPTGVVTGAGVGLLHSLHCNSKIVADIIPADFVINNIIASAWNIGKTWEKKCMQKTLPTIPDEKDDAQQVPPIYNVVTSIQNPITWGEYMKENEYYGFTIPTIFAVWYYFFTLNKYLWIHNIYIFFLDIIPATIVDVLARLTGRKPILVNTYKKIHKFSGVISYFSTQQWRFRNNNVLALWDKMSPVDQKIFFFHVSKFKWQEYFYYHARGIRLYLVKDQLSTVEQAHKRLFKLKIAHYTLGTIYISLILWLIYSILSVPYWLMIHFTTATN